MSDYPIRSTARIFYDSDGNECTLYQLVKREPDWARNRILHLEEKEQQLQQENAVLREQNFAMNKTISDIHNLGNEFDRMHRMVASRYVCEQIGLALEGEDD